MEQDNKEKYRLMRSQVVQKYRKGAMQEALNDFNTLLIDSEYQKLITKSQQLSDQELLYYLYFNLKEYGKALHLIQNLVQNQPENVKYLQSLATTHLHLQHYEQAAQLYKKCLQLAGDQANFYDGLAHAYGALEQKDQFRHFGEKALHMKDQQVCQNKAFDIPSKKPPAFSNQPKHNIISFSLFGAQPRYCEAAFLNITQAQKLYPQWLCRFYCDETVPQSVRAELEKSEAQVILQPRHQGNEGLMWRFLVIDDPNVQRFLIRDCDSVISEREVQAVQEWLDSDSYFHVMRDQYCHTELILAGMWGGVTGVFPNVENLIQAYLSREKKIFTHMDQHFLREMIWPTIRNSLCSHDRYFSFENARAFPGDDSLYVGQNEATAVIIGQVNLPNGSQVLWSLCDDQGQVLRQYKALVQGGQWVSAVPQILAQKIQEGLYQIHVQQI